MADQLTTYEGQGPDGPFSINLPAWATEATQAKVLKQLNNMNQNFKTLPKNMGDAFSKALKGNAKALEKLSEQAKKQSQQQKNKNDSDKKNQSKTQKAQDALVNQMFNNAQALKDLEDLTKKNGAAGGGSLMELAGKAGPLGIAMNLLGKATGGLISVFKGLFAAVTTITAFIGREFFKVFNKLNDSLTEGTGRLVGAFTDAPVDFAGEASRAGLSIKEFGDALARNAEEIVTLGTENFRRLRNQIVDMEGGLFDMGFSQEQITEMLGREMSIRVRLGAQLDESGRDLGINIRQVAQEVRMLGNAAGINADILYEAGKQTDETNALIAARARAFGNVGINALSTSVRTLAMRITALSPNFGKEISEPLINAMMAGAVGLDSAFTDLVTVMPGLVSVFQQGRDEIMNSGQISENTISDMVESLAQVSDEEFHRAKMLALMTRNQSAINLVNFASEARAREKLLDQINKAGDEGQGETIRSAARISRQFEIFIDMIKAPFENAIFQFAAAFLGTNLNDKDANLGALIVAFNNKVSEFLQSLPVLGSVFDSEFFTQFNNLVESFFNNPGDEQKREEARAGLNALITDKISEFGDTLGDALANNNLGATISQMFKDFIDSIAVEVYEATGFMMKQAFNAYMNTGQVEKAQELASFHGSDLITGFLGAANETFVSREIYDKLDDQVNRDMQNFKGMRGTTGFGMPTDLDALVDLLDDMEGRSPTKILDILQDEDILGDDATVTDAADFEKALRQYYSQFRSVFKEYNNDNINTMLDGDMTFFAGALGGIDKDFQRNDADVLDLMRRFSDNSLFANLDPSSYITNTTLPYTNTPNTPMFGPDYFSNIGTFADNVQGIVPGNQNDARTLSLLDNFLGSEDFAKIISDSVITVAEARQIVGDSETPGMLDNDMLNQLKLTETTNLLLREEMIKFLRTLDRDGLLKDFSYE